MKKLRVAIIGQGRSGRGIHGKFYKGVQNEWYEVAYVAEIDPFRMNRAAEEYPGCTVMSDWRELLNKTDIDLVLNDTYSDEHYPITKELLLAGFNVLVEKPFARNYYECSDLIRIAKEKGVVLAVFQQTFFAPFYLKAKELVESGIIGDLKQVSIRYNGLVRRWDWQTLQSKVAGAVYNTGPHPVGLALAFLDFDKHSRVEFSKLDLALASGDAEDYAKIIFSAPDKPVIDLEISAIDAFSDYLLKFQGTRGTLKCKGTEYKMKYIIEGENEPRPVIAEALSDADGNPTFCKDNLIIHEEEGAIGGSAFDVAVRDFYAHLYKTITEGVPMPVTAEMAAMIVNMIEVVHAQNPMPVKY